MRLARAVGQGHDETAGRAATSARTRGPCWWGQNKAVGAHFLPQSSRTNRWKSPGRGGDTGLAGCGREETCTHTHTHPSQAGYRGASWAPAQSTLQTPPLGELSQEQTGRLLQIRKRRNPLTTGTVSGQRPAGNLSHSDTRVIKHAKYSIAYVNKWVRWADISPGCIYVLTGEEGPGLAHPHDNGGSWDTGGEVRSTDFHFTRASRII